MTGVYEYKATAVVAPRSELRELSDQTPAQANWHTAARKVEISPAVVTAPSILMRYYLRKDGQIATVMQRRIGTQVVWDSRHAQPTQLAVNGAAYRQRTRRRKP